MKIETETLLRILNLPEDEKIIMLFNEHSDGVIRWFNKIAEAELLSQLLTIKWLIVFSYFLRHWNS